MAITIRTQPDTHTPAYNEQWYICSSSNSSQPNFKYVVTTTIDGIAQTQKFQKRPDNNLLYFNPQRIAESFVSAKFYTALDKPTPSYYEIKKVIVEISEEYGSPVSGFTPVTGTHHVWNSAYNSSDFSTFTYAASSNIKQLTLAPNVGSVSGISTSTDKINFNQKYLLKSWHIGWGNLGTDGYQLEVIAYDVNSNMLQDTYIYNDQYAGALPARYITNVNCSPYGLNLIKTNNPANILSQTDPTGDVVPANTYFYVMRWFNSSPSANSIIHEVVIDTFCSNYDRYVLHFLNRLGNFDSFTFNLLSKKTVDKSTKDYVKVPYTLDGNYNYEYFNWESGRVNYNTVLTNKITVNSNWVNETQYAWLMDLFRSPRIVLEDESNNLFAVTCTLKNIEEKQKSNEKVFNFVVDLEYDYQDIRQRG
jgi:hypothetical protein